ISQILILYKIRKKSKKFEKNSIAIPRQTHSFRYSLFLSRSLLKIFRCSQFFFPWENYRLGFQNTGYLVVDLNEILGAIGNEEVVLIRFIVFFSGLPNIFLGAKRK
ncbi:hypothetical protein TorRG33x02_341080, partial [Trema orientale]